jgi:N-acetylmuramoyl-L-alanine amidase
MAKTICLSAGHGAGDVGAKYKNLQESDLTIKIAQRAAEIIRKHGVGTLYVPDTLTLQGTINWINERANQITICVDVHINSGNGTGVEAWNYIGGPNESDKLSQFLADACAAETGLKNRGIKDETDNRHKRLGFIRDTAPIAALVECGFIDGDYDYLNKPEGIEAMARGVARGCLGYTGVQWNPSLLNGAATPPKPSQPAVDYKKLYEEVSAEYNAYKKKMEKIEQALQHVQSILSLV